MCADCFDLKDHEVGFTVVCNVQGHDFERHDSTGGGCCDCGDVESWKKECWCKKHRNAQEILGPELLIDEQYDLVVGCPSSERQHIMDVMEVCAQLLFFCLNKREEDHFMIDVCIIVGDYVDCPACSTSNLLLRAFSIHSASSIPFVSQTV